MNVVFPRVQFPMRAPTPPPQANTGAKSALQDTVSLSTPRPGTPADAALSACAAPIGGPVAAVVLGESERLAEFFRAGGGSTEGLRAPDLASGLLAARQDGAAFLGHGRDPDPLTPVEAYRIMLSSDPRWNSVYLGIDGIQMVACSRDTLESGLEAFHPLSAAHREVLRHGRFDAYAMQCALDRIAGQREPRAIGEHASLLVDIYDRVKASGKSGSSEDTAHAMTRLYDWLSPRFGEIPAERLADVLAWTSRGGADEARAAGAHAGDLEGERYDEFARVMGAMGSASDARRALEAVDLPGHGPRADRMAALTKICAEAGSHALTSYHAVVDAWDEDESLSAITDRYVTLHRALSARGHAPRATECFQDLERLWRASGDTSPDATYLRFLDRVKRGGAADVALLAIEPRDPAVERQGDAVMLAGVRVPVRIR